MTACTDSISNRTTAHRVLVATSISYTVVLLDASIVNVALKEISHTLHSNVAGLQWIVNAYTLTFASLVLPAGALADRYGRKRILLLGLGIFTVASFLCGMAPSIAAAISGLTLRFVRATPSQRVRINGMIEYAGPLGGE